MTAIPPPEMPRPIPGPIGPPVPVEPPVPEGPACSLCGEPIGDGWHITVTASDSEEPGLYFCADCLVARFPESDVSRLALLTKAIRQVAVDPKTDPLAPAGQAEPVTAEPAETPAPADIGPIPPAATGGA
jgi:hypothetical protein